MVTIRKANNMKNALKNNVITNDMLCLENETESKEQLVIIKDTRAENSTPGTNTPWEQQ